MTTVHVMYAVVGGEGRIYAQIGDDQVVHGFPAKFAKALAEREKYMAEMDALYKQAAPIARRIVGARTADEEIAACRDMAKLFNDDLDRCLHGESAP